MRVGTNPEKINLKEINYKLHRIIIPVYIPNSKEEYFINALKVFKTSINSLIHTVDESYTNITIINNNCINEITEYLDNLLEKKKIDKHVKLSNNYGKVYTVLSEAKASYEELITIADADIFYFSNWLKKSIDIFNKFNRVGVVAPLPMPQLAFYCNNSLFFYRFFKISKGKVVKDKDLRLFEESVNSKISLKKYNWFKKQLYIRKTNTIACLGAGHFIATYRRDILQDIKLKKPKYAFENGVETLYLDMPIDKLGYYRLSTIETYVYHMGNTIPDFLRNYVFKERNVNLMLNKHNYKKSIVLYSFRNILKVISRKIISIK